jgi:hypothetical protein
VGRGNIDYHFERSTIVKISGVWMGVIAIVLGILVLALPDIIRLTVGVGLIVLGIMALVRK